jgi:hypothetical protein
VLGLLLLLGGSSGDTRDPNWRLDYFTPNVSVETGPVGAPQCVEKRQGEGYAPRLHSLLVTNNDFPPYE